MPLLVPLTQLSNTSLSSLQDRVRPEPVIEKLLGGLQNKHQAQLETAATRANVETTKTLMDVLVKEQKALSPQLQQSLQQSLRQQLLGPTSSSTNSSPITKPSDLLQQQLASRQNAQLQNLLSKNDLVLVKLLVNNKIQWAVSADKISTGKTLNLNIEDSKIWRVTDVADKALRLPSITSRETITQAIRESLPQATNITTAFRNLQQLNQQAFKQGILLPRNIQAANHKLQQLSSTPRALAQSNQLQNILRQSGFSYEAKIYEAKLYQTKTTETKIADGFPTPNPVNGHGSQLNQGLKPLGNSALDKIILSFLKADKGRPNNQASKRTVTSTPPKLSDLPTSDKNTGGLGKDIKAQLIILKQITNAFLKSTGTTVKSEQSQTLPANKSLPETQATTKATDHGQTNSAQIKIVQQIQQQAIAAIAKIQLQQAQSLLHSSMIGADSKAPRPVLQLELPVQIDQNLHSLHVKIEQDWIDKLKQEDESDGQEREKAKRWLVNLSFDLPNIGMFYARITHIDFKHEQNTRVHFWADKEKTLNQAREKLNTLKTQLQSQGITVDELRCEPGLPAVMGNKIDCALVDVCT